jgi:D-3-phosphoglycerate dehydrogenase
VTALGADVGEHVPLLTAAGFEVLPGNRSENLWDNTSLIRELRGCSAIVAGSEPYPRAVLEALPELRVIARTGVGFDAIDLPAADDCGVVVATTPGVNHHAVAEHAIALMMSFARAIVDQDVHVRRGEWIRYATPRVMGRTMGLVGLGRIGQATATRAAGLGMKVIAFEPYPNVEFCRQHGIELVDLPTLLGRADYISLHSPLSRETRHLINADSLARVKPEAVLINTARGGLVDERALIAALTSGRLRGAGLDVVETEPLPVDSPLIGLRNVVLTGHVAGLDIESQRDTVTMCAETIIALRDGGWPQGCIQNLKGRTDWKWTR